MNLESVLDQCIITDKVVKLPDIQLDRKLYLEVAKRLEFTGGKWNRKFQGFLFEINPSELLDRVKSGEKVNLKKEFQFFETPENICDIMVEKACIQSDDMILEPSAGRGAILKAIHKKFSEKDLFCYELNDINRAYLDKLNHVVVLGDDFLEAEEHTKYNVIIANPPFAKNQDIDHICKMYKLLYKGGRLITIASTHWVNSNHKKETQFREWLELVNAEVEDIEAGAFSESGTKIATKMIKIVK